MVRQADVKLRFTVDLSGLQGELSKVLTGSIQSATAAANKSLGRVTSSVSSVKKEFKSLGAVVRQQTVSINKDMMGVARQNLNTSLSIMRAKSTISAAAKGPGTLGIFPEGQKINLIDAQKQFLSRFSDFEKQQAKITARANRNFRAFAAGADLFERSFQMAIPPAAVAAPAAAIAPVPTPVVSSFDKLRASVSASTTALAGNMRAAINAQRSLSGAAFSAGLLSKEELRAQNASEHLAKSMQGLHNVSSIFMGLALYRTFGLITRSIREALGALVEFDVQLARVNSLIGGNDVTVRNLSEGLLELSKTVPRSAGELGAGAYVIASAGITDQADALKLLAITSRAASAGVTDVKTATETILSVMNAYQVSVENATIVADKLFEGVKRGIFTFEELHAALGTVVSVASAFSIPLSELVGAMETMTKGGLNASRSTVALRQAIQNISKPSKEASELANSMGIEMTGAALSGKGLLGFFEDFSNKIGLTSQEQDMLAASTEKMVDAYLIGEEEFENVSDQLIKTGQVTGKIANIFTSRNGLMAAVLLTGKRLDIFKSDVAATTDSMGAMNEAFDLATKNIRDNNQIALNNLTIAFSGLLPVMRETVELIKGLSSFLANHKEVVVTVTIALAGLLGSLVALSAVKLTTTAFAAFGQVLFTMSSRIDEISLLQFHYNTALADGAKDVVKLRIAQEISDKQAVLSRTRLLGAGIALTGVMMQFQAQQQENIHGANGMSKSLDVASVAMAGLGVAMAAATLGMGAWAIVVGLIVAGIVALVAAFSHGKSEAEKFAEVLEGTAEDIEKDVFERISSAAQKSTGEVLDQLDFMKQGFDRLAASKGLIPVGGLKVPEADILAAQNIKQDRFAPGFDKGVGRFFAQGVRGLQAGPLGGVLPETPFASRNIFGRGTGITPRIAAETGIDEAIRNLSDASRIISDELRETAKSAAIFNTIDREISLRDITDKEQFNAAKKALDTARLKAERDYIEGTQIALLSGQFEQQLGLDPDFAKNLAEQVILFERGIKVTRNENEELVFSLVGGVAALNEFTGATEGAAEEIAAIDFADLISDISSAFSAWKEPLQRALDNWATVGDSIAAIGVSADEVSNALSILAESQIKLAALNLLETLKKMQDAVIAGGGTEIIPGLADAILGVQKDILTNAAMFLTELMTKDPAELADILARQTSIEQNIDQSNNVNVVFRISGDTNLNTRQAAVFADLVMAEIQNKQRQRGGAIRR